MFPGTGSVPVQTYFFKYCSGNHEAKSDNFFLTFENRKKGLKFDFNTFLKLWVLRFLKTV